MTPTKKVGSRREVFSGTAEMTSSGLRKGDLIKNPAGRIVSRKKSMMAKKNYRKTLQPYTEAMKKISKSRSAKSKKTK